MTKSPETEKHLETTSPGNDERTTSPGNDERTTSPGNDEAPAQFARRLTGAFCGE